MGSGDTWIVRQHWSNYPLPLLHIPPLLSSLSSALVCVRSRGWSATRALTVALLLLFSQPAALWFFDRKTSCCPPLADQPPPRLSPSPPSSLHLLLPHLPPRRLVEREQPLLSKHKDRSCQQVAMATASLTAATSPLGKRECGELQGPSLLSTLSHSPN